jgi:MarR family transcriptional regulator, negative regulator of the multidrug operon emrRAB
MRARETVELLIQAARVAHTSHAAAQLGPAEWMALRFLARANLHSRKPSALADYVASSRAAVSRVIGRLEEGGYLTRQPTPEDGRSYSLEVTPKGEAVLRHDPINSLVLAVGLLPHETREALHDSLRQVLTRLSEIGARRHFDTCRDCAHLGAGDAEPVPWLRCNLFNQVIEEEAAQLLCAYFQATRAEPCDPT